MSAFKEVEKVISKIQMDEIYTSLAEGTTIEIIITDPQGKKKVETYTVASGKTLGTVEVIVEGDFI